MREFRRPKNLWSTIKKKMNTKTTFTTPEITVCNVKSDIKFEHTCNAKNQLFPKQHN